jgi:hypothetical protein
LVGQEPDHPKVDKLESASPDAPKILGSAGALPSKKKPFAIRCRFSAVLPIAEIIPLLHEPPSQCPEERQTQQT